MLCVENLEVVYDDVSAVLHGVSLQVPARGIVALLGANGAGKTTLLRAVAGLLPLHRGAVTKGTVRFDGLAIGDAAHLASAGIGLTLEGRRVFGTLSVEDNLRAGGFRAGRRARVAALDRVYTLFPVLAERRRLPAGYLSGGEQQMLAIGRALMTAPRLLLLDEPTLGLAPIVQSRIRTVVRQINADGTAVLLVEQNAHLALELADHGYVMETGRIVLDATASELAANPDVQEFYLGLGPEGRRRSYRDVKRYRRRKRWLS